MPQQASFYMLGIPEGMQFMTKTARVTAAAGIGRACAMRLAGHGVAVGLLDINLEGCGASLPTSFRVAVPVRSSAGRAGNPTMPVGSSPK